MRLKVGTKLATLTTIDRRCVRRLSMLDALATVLFDDDFKGAAA